jgi:hypothetical protein
MGRTIQSTVILALLTTPVSAWGAGTWGRLANPGFENQPIKSVFFFAGSARDGTQFYEYKPSSNTALYTIHPSDARHLQWSRSPGNRAFALDTMIEAGVNVINMSYWGPRGTDNWAYWAPMQTSTFAHDELFQAAVGKNILIAPYVEGYAATPSSSGYSFVECFPGQPDNPAPELVAHLKDLVERYLRHPADSRWAGKWAQVYDRSGGKRYLVCLIAVASNQDGMTDERFARGFDQVADRIFRDTGVRIGFAIDAMPPDTYVWAQFLPSAETTGPWLFQQQSILAIQAYFSGHSIGVTDEDTIIEWKQRFASKWINTGIPFLQDISPGYDAHIVFPGPHIFGNTDSWRQGQSQLVRKLKCQGVTFSAWNGYTEGYAGVPTVEYGDAAYLWAGDLFRNFVVDGRHPLPGRIEAEDYNDMYGVEKEVCQDDGGGFDSAGLNSGDWLDYKVAVPTEGEYLARLRVARAAGSLQGGAQLRAGPAILTSFNVPSTGGGQDWRTVESTVELPAGAQTLRLYVTAGPWNVNWLEFRRAADVPYHELPCRIEAEDYEDMVGIKTQIVLDEEPGFNAGWLDAGDWLDYLVDVRETHGYTVAVRVALADGFPGSQGQLRVGNNVLWTFSIPSTGGWQTWKTIQGQVNLEAGKQRLRVYVVQGPWNLNWIEFSRESGRPRGR